MKIATFTANTALGIYTIYIDTDGFLSQQEVKNYAYEAGSNEFGRPGSWRITEVGKIIKKLPESAGPIRYAQGAWMSRADRAAK
jgi:hypothetical protein